jgi:hypothetical protein
MSAGVFLACSQGNNDGGSSSVQDFNNIASMQVSTDAQGNTVGQTVHCTDGRLQFAQVNVNGSYTIFQSGSSPAAWAQIAVAANASQVVDVLCAGPAVPTAVAASLGTFSCDGSGSLRISVFSPTGVESDADVGSTDLNSCLHFSTALSSSHAQISTSTIVAACDGSAVLHRLVISANGQVHDLGPTYVGDPNSCVQQADAINAQSPSSSIPLLPGQVASFAGYPGFQGLIQPGGVVPVVPILPAVTASIGAYSCDGSGTLQIDIVTPSGASSAVQVAQGNPQACLHFATSLTSAHSSIATTTLLAACDGAATLHRFSVTQTGQLHTLSTVSVGSVDTCAQQADAINYAP